MSDSRQVGGAPIRIVRCPTCRRSVPWKAESRFRPFCSERCQLIDLGAWADGQHAIPGDGDWGDEGQDPDTQEPS